MDFWSSVAAQFLGDLGAGILIATAALWIENRLDERRETRHGR